MNNTAKNILIFIIIILVAIFVSYFIFSSGITNKLKGSVEELSASINGTLPDDLPIINSVINSSGEELVNTDVAIIIDANSKYDISRVEYSYDLKKWIVAKDNFNSKNINNKIVFKNDINKTIYFRVVNKKGYKSYPYKTTIMIDKKNPEVSIKENVINAKDETGLSAIQYSNDKMDWVDEEIYGNQVILEKKNIDYKYIRVVDKVGNISNIKKTF